MSDIPAGYQIHIRSWENDADHYKTTITSGLNNNEVRFFIEIANQFNSQNEWREGKTPGFGNDTMNVIDMYQVLDSAFAKHGAGLTEHLQTKIRNILDEYNEEDDEAFAESAYEWLTTNILGFTVDYIDYDFFVRVVDDIKVFYISGAADVTSEFINPNKE